MTPEAFLALVMQCHLALPPGITPDRLLAYAQVESGLNPQAVSLPNRNGSRDRGLLQINDQWLSRFGATEQTVMEPCTNLRIGVAILADADRQAACLYNTGHAACRNGYDLRIQRASARLTGLSAPSAPPPQAAPTRLAPSFGRGAAGRDFSYVASP